MGRSQELIELLRSRENVQSVCHEMADDFAIDYLLDSVGIHPRFVLRGINEEK